MTACDHEFYNNQCLTPQIGYCSRNINAKWEKTQKRKAFDNYLLERSRESNMVGRFVLHLLLMNIIHSHSKYKEVKILTTFLF